MTTKALVCFSTQLGMQTNDFKNDLSIESSTFTSIKLFTKQQGLYFNILNKVRQEDFINCHFLTIGVDAFVYPLINNIACIVILHHR